MTGYRRTVFRGCTLCEASCGLALELEGDRIVSVRGDDADPLSHGFICAKGVAIADVHHDPDRLRSPMRRTADGKFEPIGWEEAFAIVAARLNALRATHGPDAIALYLGNPIIHNHTPCCCGRVSFTRSAPATASARARRTRARASRRPFISTARRWSRRCPTLTARIISSASGPTPRCRTAAS
jgi:anaerobic selenocysteine-containing dehydrogenase